MSKLKLFIENFLIYGLGGVIGKIIPVIMVPIVTRMMPDSSYFGVSDMTNTIVSFASAFAIMGMYDAMYRMFFEKEDDAFKHTVCSTALCFTLFSSLIVALVLVLARRFIAKLAFADTKYLFLVYFAAITTFSSATNSIISAPTRMQNKRKVYLVTNFVSPLISYSVAVTLLLSGHYIIALPLGHFLSGFIMECVFGVMNRNWFSLKKIDFKLLKPLLTIAIPTLPGFLIYWVFNSSDKLMITNIIGLGAAGIYSVGAKLGQASHLIYTAFAGGWQYFAFSTMKEDNQVKSNSMVFEYLGLLAFTASVFVFAWSHMIYELLFVGEYVQGYIIAPYLFLAPLLLMLYQVAGNQFLVVKNTLPFTLTLSVGAVLNVGLNLLLIPRMGIEGAAVATLIGYIVSDIACVAVLMRMKLFVLSGRFVAAAGIMAAYMIVWRLFFCENIVMGTLLALAAVVGFFLIYRKDIIGFICTLLDAAKQRRATD